MGGFEIVFDDLSCFFDGFGDCFRDFWNGLMVCGMFFTVLVTFLMVCDAFLTILMTFLDVFPSC